MRAFSRSAALVLTMTAIGTPAAFAQSALTPEQLTVRVERLTEISQRSEEKLSNVQSQLQKLSEDMSRLGRLIDNQAMIEMIQQVDALSEEISQLNGAIEQQGYDIENIKKRQRELYLDIDRRLPSGGLQDFPVSYLLYHPSGIPRVERSHTKGHILEDLG